MGRLTGTEMQPRLLRSRTSGATILLAAVALAIGIAPIGFVGGGFDDWQYLDAARCWREHGVCLPNDHWEGRWPVFAPIALITALFGESRLTVSVWPLLSSLSALFLLVRIGNRQFEPPVGWIASFLLLATPAFSTQLLAPSADALELALVLAGVLAALEWLDGKNWRWAVLCGLAFGMAMQVRETALIPAAFTGIYILFRRPPLSQVTIAAAAFAAPFLLEFAIYALWTGDPLWRRTLSLHHTQIASTELPRDLGTSGPPFFNKAYIANWHHEPGVHVHWAVDGILNLFLNVKAGLALLLVPLMASVAELFGSAGLRRRVIGLWLIALAHALIVIFALALDPNPRIMFVPIAAATLALAVCTWSAKQAGRAAIAYTVWGVSATIGIGVLLLYPRTDLVEGPASQWIARHRGNIETNVTTKRQLALVKSAAGLPLVGSGRDYLLLNPLRGCTEWFGETSLSKDSLTLIDSVPMTRVRSPFAEESAQLCLFRYNQPLSREQILQALKESKPGRDKNT